MRARRFIARLLVVSFVLLLVAAAFLYVLACRVPPNYKPVQLSRPDKDAAMRQFRRRLMDFSNDGQTNVPFTWSVDQAALNAYLEAMDHIAEQAGAKPGSAHRMMVKLALRDPAVALDDGAVTLMARSTKHEKIISIQLRLDLTPAGRLRVRLGGAKVGMVPVPSAVLRAQVERLKAALARSLAAEADAPDAGSVGVSSRAVGQLLGRVVAAIDGEPIDTEMSWKLTARKRVRIERIDIDDGKLTLHVVPVERGSAEDRKSAAAGASGAPTRPTGG